MPIDVTPNSAQAADHFSAFPEFSKLKLSDRYIFESAVGHYPPTDATSFAPLMTWWNSLDNLAVSRLAGNLVISYWLPGMERLSGVSIIGTSNVDEAVCAVFDYQKERGEQPRLVHIPDFVVNSIEHPELFIFTPMHEFDEYIMPVSALYPLDTVAPFKRRRIELFQHRICDESVGLENVNLYISKNRVLLLEALIDWSRDSKGNSFSKFSDEAACKMIAGYKALDVKCLGLYKGNELQGFFLYFVKNGESCAHVMNLRFKNDIPYSFEFGFYKLCEWFSLRGIETMNLGYDVGMARLRAIKLGLGPTSFVRKYIVEPRS